MFQRGAFRPDLIDLGRVLGGDDGDFRPGFVNPVSNILGGELHGARHGHNAGLHAADQHLVPGRDAWNHHQGKIPLRSSQPQENVGKPVGLAVQVLEAVALDFPPTAVDVNEGGLVRFPCPGGDDVEPEVEILRHAETE